MDGETYQKLIKQVKEELDIDLNVCLLEQVRRRKSKLNLPYFHLLLFIYLSSPRKP